MRRRSRHAVSPFGIGAATAVFMSLLIAFLDLTSSTQMIGLASAAMSISFVNPAPKNNGDKKLNVTPVPLYVRLRWGDGLPHDLDLWVACYHLVNGEKVHPLVVGYKRTSDGWLDLTRDDQGAPSYLNEETVMANSEVSRVPSNARCWFNVHLYNSHGGKLPVEGSLVVIQNKDGNDEILIGDVKFSLAIPGEERTILAATWNEDGLIIVDALERYPDVKTRYVATKPGG